MHGLPDKGYTRDHVKQEDGSVAFACSQNLAEWPWLELPPHHPVPLQTQNFWVSVECGKLLGDFDDTKWSALTWTRWACGDSDVGMAVRGTYSRHAEGIDRGFTSRLYDAEDRLIVEMLGKGVVFRTRNFEKWRESAKQAAARAAANEGFAYADRALLGLSDGENPFCAPLSPDRSVRALITPDNGFMPGNPYIGGSGDHVNSTHIAETARQFLSLLLEGAPFRLTGGEIAFNRYVELGTQMELTLIEQADESAHIGLSQLGKPCTDINLRYELI